MSDLLLECFLCLSLIGNSHNLVSLIWCHKSLLLDVSCRTIDITWDDIIFIVRAARAHS